MKNSDAPSMPVMDEVEEHGQHYGLTKREEFAKAMAQGLLAGGYCIDDARNRLVDVPNEAVNLADTLLKALEESS